MSGGIDLSGVERLYTESLMRHGPVPPGVGWKDAAAQNLRFVKLLEVVRGYDGEFSVNDLGCGYGALWTFLRQNGLPVRKYYGYDISEAMLAEARTGIDSDAVELICGNRLSTQADFSFASGIFNVRLETPVKKWEAYVKATIHDLARNSTAGFAFNLLTSYVDYREDHLYYGDPAEYLGFCKRNFGRVGLLHDYPLYEWTIFVRLD